MVEIEQRFESSKPVSDLWGLLSDLQRLIPCVQGGAVLRMDGPGKAHAEIKVRMGAMSLTFKGVVETVESSEAEHRAVMRVTSREVGGSGHANADVTFTLHDGGGVVHTAAAITGKAASMGEGVIETVLQALIRDFTESFVATA